MEYVPAANLDGTDQWKDGDRSAGVRGSPVSALVQSQGQTELVNLIDWANANYPSALIGDPTKDKLTQVLESIQAIAFPSSDAPPAAPNLPQLLAVADGTQSFPDGTPVNVAYQTTTENLINSVWDGTTLTIGSQDEGLYSVVGGIRFSTSAVGLDYYLKKNAQNVANDGRTTSIASNLGTSIGFCDRLVAGDTILSNCSLDNALGGNANPNAGLTRLAITKISV